MDPEIKESEKDIFYSIIKISNNLPSKAASHFGCAHTDKSSEKAIDEDVLLERIEVLKREFLELEMAVRKR